MTESNVDWFISSVEAFSPDYRARAWVIGRYTPGVVNRYDYKWGVHLEGMAWDYGDETDPTVAQQKAEAAMAEALAEGWPPDETGDKKYSPLAKEFESQIMFEKKVEIGHNPDLRDGTMEILFLEDGPIGTGPVIAEKDLKNMTEEDLWAWVDKYEGEQGEVGRVTLATDLYQQFQASLKGED